jgi:hypothetical protein
MAFDFNISNPSQLCLACSKHWETQARGTGEPLEIQERSRGKENKTVLNWVAWPIFQGNEAQLIIAGL